MCVCVSISASFLKKMLAVGSLVGIKHPEICGRKNKPLFGDEMAACSGSIGLTFPSKSLMRQLFFFVLF